MLRLPNYLASRVLGGNTKHLISKRIFKLKHFSLLLRCGVCD